VGRTKETKREMKHGNSDNGTKAGASDHRQP
jgi:hypothetical protein